jgi:baculoviral IAP repeat-containing protein 6
MTRPAVTLSEAMTQDQLERLILLASNLDLHYGNVSWGGPWAGHAITCLLQDILDGKWQCQLGRAMGRTCYYLFTEGYSRW